MIKVGIVGGDTLVAGELIGLLINHPDIELEFVQSADKAGCPITDVHGGLFGETSLSFVDEIPFEEINCLFLCVGQGESRRFMESHTLPEKLRIVDFSADYRLAASNEDFIYGLPELNRKYIIRGERVANAGCLSAAILLPLLPLAKNLLLNSEINVRSVIGTLETESGILPAHLSEEVAHPHLKEVYQGLTQLQNSFSSPINLTLNQGDFSRGIVTTIEMDCPIDLAMVKELYEAYYDDHNFTFVIDRKPELSQVINTNKCLLYLEKQEGKLEITSVVDHVLKGASGQAMHNMNLLFGLHERVGLALKPFVG